jgi:hypothetical protein
MSTRREFGKKLAGCVTAIVTAKPLFGADFPVLHVVGSNDYINFDGEINDFRRYNRSLTQDEITRLYKVGPQGQGVWSWGDAEVSS